MQRLESMEKGTPEFQRLTPLQQNERRQILSQTLERILEDSSFLGLSAKETILSAYASLELHLTGKIERLPYQEKTNKKGKIK